MRIALHGSGVAAAACAHLLRSAGLPVRWQGAAGAGAPGIMLTGQSLHLLRDVFDAPNLLADRHRITRRVVSWGEEGRVGIPHEGIVVSGKDLRAELQSYAADAGADDGDCDLAIHTASPLPEGDRLVFGERQAEICRVEISDAGRAQECRVESLEEGWLFLLPDGDRTGWLLGFGAPLAHLLASSRLVAPIIDLAEHAPRRLDSAPALAAPLAGQDWLACGSAALRFDPICGDGTAQAVREAVLAAAVVRAIADGGDRDALLVHYRSMLIAGMRRHLKLCAQFYANGGRSEWWQDQTAALARGHEACTRMLAGMPEPQFVLRGFSLRPHREAA